MSRMFRAFITLSLAGILIWSSVLGKKAKASRSTEEKDVSRAISQKYFCRELDEKGILMVASLDVGQGDSVVVRAPGGKTLLIDGGPRGNGKYLKNAGEKDVIPFLNSLGIERIDVIVSTHQDNDHLGGLIPVICQMDVGCVYDNGNMHVSYTYESYLNALDKKKIPVKIVTCGDRIDLGNGVHLQVLSQLGGTEFEGNENSIVLKLVYGDVSMLFTGDIEEKAERALICSWGKNLRSNILKVPHHGSKSSSSWWFLDIVQPETALISVGRRNPFGHPAKEVLNRLEASDNSVFRTDVHGNIAVFCNGKTYSVSMEKGSPIALSIQSLVD
ncbi:MAG: ComEC/Rec2 family competence protein [Candidatus Theseobacter exili]|nr:ComEC/Rec2 family competence protein [Candidatus Theseobacter exili]